MTVIEVKFRKAGRSCPPLSALSLADNGGRGDINLAAPTISHPRYDAHADGFHATESLGETLLRQGHESDYWRAWLNGFAFGVLIVSTMALIWWPHP